MTPNKFANLQRKAQINLYSNRTKEDIDAKLILLVSKMFGDIIQQIPEMQMKKDRPLKSIDF